MRISVIMAAYLGQYPGCATNRENKFKRAVESFIRQSYSNKELIIVSDGCDITENIYKDLYINYESIIFKRIEKDITFGGKTRNTGLELVTGDYICYLDTDDFISKTHLTDIINNISEHDWYYTDDSIVTSFNNVDDFTSKLRVNFPVINHIGTSTIIHKKNNLRWSSGYGHDWMFVNSLINNSSNYTKIDICSYNVCHIPTQIDL